MKTELAKTTHELSMAELATNGDNLTKTGMLPDHIRTGWQFAAIALTGREMGMAPMRAVRSLTMVKGKVEEAAASQLARFKASGGRAEFGQLTETVAELRLTHPNGDKHVETFTIEDAKLAGLAAQPNFKKYPKAMLRSRVITAGLKSLGWEGAVGVYDPSELNEPLDEPAPVATESSATVEIRPKFEPEAGPRTIDEADPLAKARLAVNKCKTLDELDKASRRVDAKLEADEWTAEQAKTMKEYIMTKAQIMEGGYDE